ncbi:MAG: hypothetical protein LC808_09305 [Actinobacteria bacterium]|nr:hypothetical protein [Actinomycetota bacterium]
MKPRMVVLAVGSVTLLLLPIGTASAEPSPATRGCQTVASKFLNEDAPGHQGVMTAGTHSRGEGPCGFGDPPTGP